MTNLTSSQQAEVKKEVSKQVEKEVKKRLSKRLWEKSTVFGSEFKKQTATAIIAAFGFLIALVWRDLISKAIKETTYIQSLEMYPYLAELYIALVVTVVAVIGIAIISKWAKKN
jgi:hypothetical protein